MQKPRAVGSPLDEAGCARPVRTGVACPAFPRVEGVTEARERQQRGERDAGSGSDEDLWRADFQPRTAVRAQMVLLYPPSNANGTRSAHDSQMYVPPLPHGEP